MFAIESIIVRWVGTISRVSGVVRISKTEKKHEAITNEIGTFDPATNFGIYLVHI